MALTLGDNFSYQGAKPLDGRLKYDTLANMKAVADATMYDGCMAYCSGTDKTYQWKSTNTVDESTGKWREFTSGGGGGSYTAGDGIDITEDVISTKQSEEGDIDEIIDVYPQAGELVSIVNAFNRGDLYSTDERMIGQWINGKPLYQKTIVDTLASEPASGTIGTKNIAIDAPVEYGYVVDLTVLDVTTYVSAFYAKDDMTTFLKAYVRSNSASSNPNCITVASKAWFDDTCYVTVRYTKTTDTAISIGSVTEYSTTEKIVGTWLDGKPIYQKTIQGTMPTVATNGTSVIEYHQVGANVDQFISCHGFIDMLSGNREMNSVYKYPSAGTFVYVCLTGVNNKATSNKNTISVSSSNTTWNDMTFYATVQYTKTT